MNMMTLLRLKNRYLGKLLPNFVAQQNARIFLSPRKFLMKEWEELAEKSGTRMSFAKKLSAIRWGSSDKRILLMHGWEGRATQMYSVAAPLVEQGYEVIAIDGPKHGQSKGEKANPVEFANAIIDADKAFGPFHGAIGHSMGACALAMAYERGTNLGRYTLVASPACVHDVLKGFAWFMGLSSGVTSKFIEQIESIVGRRSKDLDVGRMLKFHNQEKLLIHAKDDLEIPYHSMAHIRDQLKNVRSISPEGLGHRKIMRDKDTIQKIVAFMSQVASTDTSVNI
ncbi:alpha/beta fold hydrolase [Oceaniserpentilla sp. 4NH20-0058]|uniref:alpha/beta hydrolase n=1 Tax=Oceaniserpentilla sp. 4NH20-0058 TaxID=3127660 RepID=UPI00310AD3EB